MSWPSWVLAVAALAPLCAADAAAETRPEGAAEGRCVAVAEALLPNAPAERVPGVGAVWLGAFAATPEGMAGLAALASASGKVEVELSAAATGLSVRLAFTGPLSAAALVDALAARAALVFPSTMTDTSDGPSGSLISRAAVAATHRRQAADADPDNAEARLALALDASAVAVHTSCAPLRAPLPASLPLIEPGGVLTLPGPPSPDPARPALLLVAPLPADAHSDDIRALTAWLSHPGSAFGRALAAPPLRIGAADASAVDGVGLLVVSLSLPRGADLRATRHALLRWLPTLRATPGSLVGAARLSGHPHPERQRAAPLLEALRDPDGLMMIAVAADDALGSPPPTLDLSARDRFVTASVELRCPAPGDSRPAEARLAARVGLDTESWRLLAREVAADGPLAAALEQEVVDRCGALSRLRARVPPALFARIYRAHRCTIARLGDSDAAFRAGRDLMARHDLDSAWLRPVLEMADGDPRLEALSRGIDAECPVTMPEETP